MLKFACTVLRDPVPNCTARVVFHNMLKGLNFVLRNGQCAMCPPTVQLTLHISSHTHCVVAGLFCRQLSGRPLWCLQPSGEARWKGS